jgi:mono/diheme cytochrome c family protein
MRTRIYQVRIWQLTLLLGMLLGVSSGCLSPPPDFQFNWVYLEVQQLQLGTPEEPAEFSEDQRRNVAEILEATFGTPQDPRLPGGLEDANPEDLVNLYGLRMAAGPVGHDPVTREPHGLFRRHCAHCHGVTGDGMGPTAGFLNPYPRDYRPGMYKFKSTKSTQKPSRSDLLRTLREGIPGTAMPSFRVLPEDELSALVDYVIYLSLRGEVERNLITMLSNLDEGTLLLDPRQKSTDLEEFVESTALVKETIQNVLMNWFISEPAVIPAPPAWWQTLNNGQLDYSSSESVEVRVRGLALFRGKAGCITCHGETALGDGNVSNYDKWTEQMVDAKAPTEEERLKPYRTSFQQYGALLPRPIRPRNLRQGVYRGGRRPIDLYHRISQGINGTPMPNQEQTLTSEEIWSLVFYVRSLPFEHASRPAGVRNLDRERPN